MAYNGADWSVGMAKERANNSAVKSLLYGGDSGLTEEARTGKKTIAQQQSRAAPFATNEPVGIPSEPGRLSAKSKLREQGAGKVGSGGFDPSVYSAAIAANAANMQASRTRNQAGSGVFAENKRAAAAAMPYAPAEPVDLPEDDPAAMLTQTVAISEAGDLISPSRPPVRQEGEELAFGQ